MQSSIIFLVAFIALINAQIHNGNFEQGCSAGNCFNLVSLPGWSVTNGNVDLVPSSLWTPHSGAYTLDINGGVSGTISQTISTCVGTTYAIDFYMSGNLLLDGQPHTVSMQLSVSGGSSQLYSYTGAHTSFSYITPETYVHQTFNFVATQTDTVITFMSTNAGARGVVLDDIVVYGVSGSTICPPPNNDLEDCRAHCPTYSFEQVYGYFCDAEGLGFCRCLKEPYASQTNYQVCAPGTVCQCPEGVECSSSGSPCA